MTAAQPDYAETVRLLPADTFTQQTRDEWVAAGVPAAIERVMDNLPVDLMDNVRMQNWAKHLAKLSTFAVVDALLAWLAAQQARPMPGGGRQ